MLNKSYVTHVCIVFETSMMICYLQACPYLTILIVRTDISKLKNKLFDL